MQKSTAEAERWVELLLLLPARGVEQTEDGLRHIRPGAVGFRRRKGSANPGMAAPVEGEVHLPRVWRLSAPTMLCGVAASLTAELTGVPIGRGFWRCLADQRSTKPASIVRVPSSNSSTAARRQLEQPLKSLAQTSWRVGRAPFLQWAQRTSSATSSRLMITAGGKPHVDHRRISFSSSALCPDTWAAAATMHLTEEPKYRSAFSPRAPSKPRLQCS
mmetsp:Transcript_29064/g.90611  ORF Transcript_29064/g.90611 Transcript_29064/m.90611 type:complete len:217 (+) Transcript_29064:415-1065(+)